MISQIGGDPNDWPSVVLTRTEHQPFTNAWRELIPHANGSVGKPGTNNATRDEVEAAARKVYANYPDLLKQVDKIFDELRAKEKANGKSKGGNSAVLKLAA